jgi:hypothetical protein
MYNTKSTKFLSPLLSKRRWERERKLGNWHSLNHLEIGSKMRSIGEGRRKRGKQGQGSLAKDI